VTPPTPRVSVIVPTFQRAGLLRLCIESFDAQADAPDFEVVVIDDGSTDDTAATLAALQSGRPWLRWSSQPTNRGPAAARNRGVSEARANLLLFVDDDVVASHDLLHTHLRLHDAADDEQLAVLGRVDWHPSVDVTPFMRWLDRSGLQFAYDTWLREGPVPPPAAFYTANLSLCKRVVVDAGGFDERFPYAAYEDLELATRLTRRGLHMDYRPAALAYHRRAIDLATFRQRMTRVGESAELMRAVAPDFVIDDRELLARRTHRLNILRARARVVARPGDDSRGDYYWSLAAAAYRRGMKRGRHQTSAVTAPD
jgi:glycosyltransferase involved in cell wall biosynthesis